MTDTAIRAPRQDSDAADVQSAALAAPGDSTADTYRTWVSEHRVTAGLLAGLVATHMATVVGYFMPGIGLPQLDWNRINGAIYTPKASPDVQFVSGGIFHYLDGVYFPHAHVGFFSHHLGWKLILAVYVWHLVYGLHLGLIYNPLRGNRPTTRRR